MITAAILNVFWFLSTHALSWATLPNGSHTFYANVHTSFPCSPKERTGLPRKTAEVNFLILTPMGAPVPRLTPSASAPMQERHHLCF